MNEGFDELEAYMKAKLAPKPRGGAGVKQGTYGQPDRRRGRPAVATGGQGSSVPQSVDFDRPHSERSAGRRLPRYSDDHDANFRREVDEGSAQDKLHRRHQELRKKSGLPDPDYYKELKASYDIEDDAKRIAAQAEIKKKYRVAEGLPQTLRKVVPGYAKREIDKKMDAGKFGKTDADKDANFQRYKKIQDKLKEQGVAEGVEQYLEEMRRAGYDIVTEAATLCPECGGPAYNNQMLAEKQDACYHKVKSRYKVWPSAYASGALVRCRKKGAKNWGNKSKK